MRYVEDVKLKPKYEEEYDFNLQKKIRKIVGYEVKVVADVKTASVITKYALVIGRKNGGIGKYDRGKDDKRGTHCFSKRCRKHPQV
jgi:hypothetical protein